MNTPATTPSDARLSAALALVAAGTTAQQIALMAVLGWVHWHHFAYMVVALALLGFGVAGTILSLFRERLLARWPAWIRGLSLGAAAAMPLGIAFSQSPALAVELPIVFLDARESWRPVALCLALLPAFLCGGLATGLALTARAARAGTLYAASLGGAGAGGLIGLAASATLPPPLQPAAVALLPFGAALCLRWGTGRLAQSFLGLGAAVVVAAIAFPPQLRPSQFKPISRALDLPESRVIAQRAGIHGWVQVVEAPALRPAAAVSLEFSGEIPRQPVVFVNGVEYGSLPDAESLASPGWLEHTTDAALFAVSKPDSVLLLENGPGGWPALAARHGARRISVVEPNRALVSLLAERSPPLAAEWKLAGVEVVRSSGRSFLRDSDDLYGAIRFPTVGALGGSSGLAAASEQFLLTGEAFEAAWTRLSPEGFIGITAWMDHPERNPLRLLSTLAESLESAGVRPADHLVAVRGWATVTFLVSRSPVDAATVVRIREFCERAGCDPLLMPGLAADARQNRHVWQNLRFFELVDAIASGDREKLLNDYPFDLRPPTDERPYFSQFLRLGAVRAIADHFGRQTIPFFELGSLVVAATFVLLLGLAFVLIALPLARLGWRGGGKLHVLLYFGGLGAGFMFVEIGLMLRVHAWLGSPVAAAALVLTTLLVSSGAGSIYSERLQATATSMRRIVSAILAAVAGAAILTIAGEPVIAGLPTGMRLVVCILIVAAVGATLGLAFPTGLRRIDRVSPAHVPWAWAVNGCLSVAAPAGAMLLAMGAGIGWLLAGAAAAYGIAFAGALIADLRRIA